MQGWHLDQPRRLCLLTADGAGVRTACLFRPFLGLDCDDAIAKMHTTLMPNRVYRLGAISAAPFDDAIADTSRQPVTDRKDRACPA